LRANKLFSNNILYSDFIDLEYENIKVNGIVIINNRIVDEQPVYGIETIPKIYYKLRITERHVKFYKKVYARLCVENKIRCREILYRLI
jgi:hypothetical protein